MAKSKDRQLLERIVSSIDEDTFDSLCEDGQNIIKDISKHIKAPLNFEKEFQLMGNITSDYFTIPEIYHSEDIMDNDCEITYTFKYKGNVILKDEPVEDFSLES